MHRHIIGIVIGLSMTNARNCSHLQQNHFKKYSQGNQDGILKAIFDVVGDTNRWAVEFGYGSYKKKFVGKELLKYNSGLNTRLLQEKGWKVVYFDAIIADLELGIHQLILSEDNIVSAFRDAGVPIDVDYVSIDVDSIDVWLLRALLKEYRPRVISVEYNRNFLSWMHLTHERKWHAWTGRSVYGASAGAINYIANLHGYTVVNIMPDAMDMFFIRQDLLDAHCTPHSIMRFEDMTNATGVGKRFHRTCNAKLDLPRLVDLHLELDGEHDKAQKKAVEQVDIINKLNPKHPMCHMT